ncbi:MAG: hypothetical protein DRO07_00225 [Candidatus Iainarchaeum archaeon]|uniref:Uncharacterized protein n=1 Tax=Candidatus Iainarchaeum sp. TaxID=3101447 RepID=A0A497JK85_9ARCH|nr:MAG: hypothetical protein DRO07_00225 [Candidatus Diapherotrites archaeon]
MARAKFIAKEDMPIFSFRLRDIFSNRKLFALLLIELFFLLLFVFEFYIIIKPAITSKSLVFSNDFNSYLLAALSVFGIAVINLALMKKQSELYTIQHNAFHHIKDTAKSKLYEQRENPYGMTMLTIEFAYVIGIAVAIYYYLDPEQSIEWWKPLGLELQAPITTIANIIVFSVITAIFIWLHAYMRQFDAIKFKGKRGLRHFKKAR